MAKKKPIALLFKSEYVTLLLQALFVALIVYLWNQLFLGYIQQHTFHEDVFRPAFLRASPPIYGIATGIDWHWFLTLCTVMFIPTFIFSKLRARIVKMTFIVLSYVLLLFLFAKTENRFSSTVAHYSTYCENIDRFEAPGDVITHYTSQQRLLNVHSAHYPPGNLWLIKWFSTYSSVTALKYSLYALMGLAFLVLMTLHKEWSLLPFITIPALLIYPSIDIVALPFFFFSLGLLVMQNVQSTLRKSIFVGVISSVWLFFSFSVFVFWLFLLLYIIVEIFKNKTLTEYLYYPLVYAAVLIVFFSLLYFTFGFSIVDNFKIALQHNIQINSNYFDHPLRFLFRSTGNALEFVLGAGLPMLLVFRRATTTSSIQQFRLPFILTVVIASFCGLFFMETDRVWFFLMAVVILFANDALQNSTRHFNLFFFVLAALYTVWFELYAIHFC